MKHLFTILFLTLSVYLFGQEYRFEKISTTLLDQIQTRTSDVHDIVVLATAQVDVQALLDSFNLHNTPVQQRAIHTNNALRNKAALTRKQLDAIVETMQLEDIQFYWIINGFRATATSSEILKLTQQESISFIDLEYEIISHEPTEVAPSGAIRNSVGNLERDIKTINAPALWKRGYTGSGRKALIIDTGVDPTHPSLKRNYAGNILPESQVWFVSPNTPRAADCGSHGTHVSGTILGIDRFLNDTIGVAYNANWMGATGLCQDGVSVFDVLQWALDPDNNPNTTDDMPDVINNSWGYPDGFFNECSSIFVDLLTALEAAGIAVVFSAGNAGPGSQSIGAPSNINRSLVNSFCVGNIDGRNLTINPGSSRGPSICGGNGSLLIKPEVSAPGTLVRSSVPGGYALFTGTSMAAPHVSGAILLLKEAFPYLSGEALKLALYFTSRDLGEPGEDNFYGMGLIDVDAAFEYLIQQGHPPVNPKFDFDIAIEEYKFEVDHCSGTLLAELILVNEGKESIEGFKITTPDGKSPSTNLIISTSHETLAPGERLILPIQAELNVFNQNNMVLEARPLNAIDERNTNNKITLDINYTPVTLIKPELNEVLFEKFICGGTTFILRNETPGTNFLWFQNAQSAQPFMRANERLVQAPNEDTIMEFYVGLEIEETILKARKEGQNTQVIPLGETGIVFTALHDIHFHHFKINPTVRAFLSLSISNDRGEIIWESNRFFSPGEQMVVVNKLLKKGGTYFLKNLTNRLVVAYEAEENYISRLAEYIQVGAMFINNNPVFDLLPTMHGFHFAAEIPCRKQSFQVKVKSVINPPKASFVFPAGPINTDEKFTLLNTSENAERILWDFGDGRFSSEDHPVISYKEAGIYQVELKAWTGSVCHDIIRHDITVETSTSSYQLSTIENTYINLFPNPTFKEFFLEIEGPAENGISSCEIISNQGQILQLVPVMNELGIFKINTSPYNLPSGIYTLRIITHDGSIHIKKIVFI